ncbi:hypothetical protein [Caulobacter sp. NIBR1757]|uniref:hypothetical protein n=1 Tax=Caulobacter sp. NIBR1757 TaxID=3016000 RepID=UPI0022EFFC90|nr:hypothetical protein [Caulobacter sp. NIBR1757]WGM38393.1 hypothetical protein AMEJIAPC_01296 [Caulobacter sp. NIBR1757]
MKRILAAAAVLTALVAAPALAQTEVSEVLIRGDNTVILRINVSGDLGPRSVVVSDDVVGINCGPDAYKYTPHENRQCWVWVRKSKTALLSAKGMKGQFGKDWSVAWTGCEVLDGGRACRIVPENETIVGAVFTGEPL